MDSCEVCGVYVSEHTLLPNKIRSREHTVIHIFVRLTIAKRIATSIDVDAQISDPFAVVWQFSDILTSNGWRPGSGEVGQGGLKVLHL